MPNRPAWRWILDSIANNAAAHFLHNMFYVLGGGLNRSAVLRQVTAELYRANAIENFDTAAIRAVTAGGVETLFLATHATGSTLGPNLCYEFERATIPCESASPGGHRSSEPFLPTAPAMFTAIPPRITPASSGPASKPRVGTASFPAGSRRPSPRPSASTPPRNRGRRS